MIRPPPDGTPAHSFCTSEAHAVRDSAMACGDAACANNDWGPKTPSTIAAIARAIAHRMNTFADLDICPSITARFVEDTTHGSG
jgi:hypothetical protein